MSHFVVRPGPPLEDPMHEKELFASEVMPRLKAAELAAERP